FDLILYASNLLVTGLEFIGDGVDGAELPRAFAHGGGMRGDLVRGLRDINGLLRDAGGEWRALPKGFEPLQVLVGVGPLVIDGLVRSIEVGEVETENTLQELVLLRRVHARELERVEGNARA